MRLRGALRNPCPCRRAMPAIGRTAGPLLHSPTIHHIVALFNTYTYMLFTRPSLALQLQGKLSLLGPWNLVGVPLQGI